MIEFVQGDILGSDAEALVNTVNCVGVMGRGIALQFRKAFPENFRVYEGACENKSVRPGHMLVFETGQLTGPKYIINFPTKRHWKGNSRLEDIKSGLNALVKEVKARKIRSIAIPPLGCGLGGLNWNTVRPLIEDSFSAIVGVRVIVFEPTGTPAAESMPRDQRVPKMTAGRAVLLELIRRYLTAVMDPFVSLLEIHKLMYFMQEAGEGLNLKYVKGTYGPYSKNLRHVLNLLEGHLISGYGDADDKPGRPIELLPGASDIAQQFIGDHPETEKHFQRVSTLIAGFETPLGMELLATVHWVATREGAESFIQVVEKTREWNARKRSFNAKQIHSAWSALRKHGWIISSSGDQTINVPNR